METYLNKRYFRVVSLLTVFTMVLYMVSAVLLVRSEAAAITSSVATLTRLQVSTATSVDISFDLPTGVTITDDEQLTLDFGEDDSEWSVDAASTTTSDIDIDVDKSSTPTAMTITEVTTDGVVDCALEGAADNQVQVDWDDTTGIMTVQFCAGSAGEWTDSDAAATVNVKIGEAAGGTNRVTNSATAGEDEIDVNFLNGAAEDATGSISVSIVDDDTVNVTGFIDSTLTFDIDTSETDEDCDASGGATPCDSHSGSTDDAGYVVDLGEMTTAAVNDSGDAGVLHADGLTGTINYIWFDLSTNADGGSVVTVISLTGQSLASATHSALEGPGANEIDSVTAETVITAGSSTYGLAFAADDGGTNSVASGSAATIAAEYDQDASAEFGSVPSDSGGGTPATIFSSTGPLDTARVQFEVGASPDSSDGTGTYTDELTFVATSTF